MKRKFLTVREQTIFLESLSFPGKSEPMNRGMVTAIISIDSIASISLRQIKNYGGGEFWIDIETKNGSKFQWYFHNKRKRRDFTFAAIKKLLL